MAKFVRNFAEKAPALVSDRVSLWTHSVEAGLKLRFTCL